MLDSGEVRFGVLWCGRQVMLGLVKVSLVVARQARFGPARFVMALRVPLCYGSARQGRRGTARYGEAWLGAVRLGRVRFGMARQAGRGTVGQGRVWSGQAWLGLLEEI